MSTRLKTLLLALLLPLLWLTPAFAQTAPVPPRLVFTPQSATIPAGTLTFTPSLSGPAATQISTLTAQNAALQALVAANAPTVYGQPYANRYSDTSPSGPHLYFPQLLLANSQNGNIQYWSLPGFPVGPSIAQDMVDLLEAHTQDGADGFAMLIGGNDATYEVRADTMLTAGDQFNAANKGVFSAPGAADFHSFLQFDLATYPSDAPTIAAQIIRSIIHPSYYKRGGAYAVSTYSGGGGMSYDKTKALWASVRTILAAQTPPVQIYFVPGFDLRDPNGNVPSAAPPVAASQEATGLMAGMAQAAWIPGEGLTSPLSPGTQLPVNELYAQALATAGVHKWCAVSRAYSGMAHPAPGRYYNEFYGGESLRAQWQSYLSVQKPECVLGFTWNDFDEGTYLSQADAGPTGKWPYFAHSSIPDYYKSPGGMVALNDYWLQQYKTGVVPTIVNDNLFVDYLPQMVGAAATSDPLGAVGPFNTVDGLPPANTFYIETLEPSTELLTVTQGSQVTTRVVSPGYCETRVPAIAGAVSFSLSQIGTGKQLVTLTGEPVLSTFAVSDYNPWTGSAHD